MIGRMSKASLWGGTQTPEDVAALVAFLASAESDNIAGQSTLPDGGIVYREGRPLDVGLIGRYADGQPGGSIAVFACHAFHADTVAGH